MESDSEYRYTQIESFSPSHYNDSTPDSCSSTGVRRWTKLRNTFRAMYLLAHQDALVVTDLEGLLQNINSTTISSFNSMKRASTLNRAIQQHRNSLEFFDLLSRASTQDLEKVEDLILNDPGRYIREYSSPDSILNRKNLNGQTPLYIACKYGNSNAVTLLLKYRADPYIQSNAGSEMETCLEVSARWGYLNIVKILLAQADWPVRELQKAMKITSNSEISLYIRGCMKHRRVGCWTC